MKEREQLFRAELERINAQYPIFKEVRGKGLLIGAELVDEWKGRARDVLVAAGDEA